MKDDKKLNKKTHKNTNDSTFIQDIRLYEGCRSDYNTKWHIRKLSSKVRKLNGDIGKIRKKVFKLIHCVRC